MKMEKIIKLQKDDRLRIRINSQVKAHIQRLAENEGITISSFVFQCIEAELDRRGEEVIIQSKVQIR